MKKIKEIIMDKPQIMKTISPALCPHCSKEILIDFQTMIPFIAGVMNMEEVKKAKEEIKSRLSEITFKEESKREEIIKWLDDDKTLISISDVEDVLKQILSDNSPVKETKDDQDKN